MSLSVTRRIESALNISRAHHSHGRAPNDGLRHCATEPPTSARARFQTTTTKRLRMTLRLCARRRFYKSRKLCLRWRDLRRILKAFNDYVSDIEGLRSENIFSVHSSKLEYCSDSILVEKTVVPHFLSSKSEMPVVRLKKLAKLSECLNIQLHWNSLLPQKNTLKSLQNVFEDVSRMLESLLKRTSTSSSLTQQGRDALDL